MRATRIVVPCRVSAKATQIMTDLWVRNTFGTADLGSGSDSDSDSERSKLDSHRVYGTTTGSTGSSTTQAWKVKWDIECMNEEPDKVYTASLLRREADGAGVEQANAARRVTDGASETLDVGELLPLLYASAVYQHALTPPTTPQVPTSSRSSLNLVTKLIQVTL